MLDAPPQPDPLLGQRIGDYVVAEAVAQGGMSVVYRGVHPLSNKRVAIKVLKEARRAGSERIDKLIAEAEAVNSIGHRNIVDIFGLGELPDGRAYIIMELLEGQGLDAWLVERGAGASIAEVVEILVEICGPLAAAHRARVIHRDLKPSNVFLCRQPDGTRSLKLLDFGLAKKAAGFDGAAEPGASVAGTPDYMAPELARGKAISQRTDLYALGCLAYRMLTGQVPFPGATAMEVMVAQVRSPTPRASIRNPRVPPRLDELVARLMAKVPDVRPASAEEVSAELKGILEDVRSPSAAQPLAAAPQASPQPASGPDGARERSAEPVAPGDAVEVPPVRSAPTPSRRGGAVLVVAIVAVAAVVLTLWWVVSRAPARSLVPVPALLPVVESPHEAEWLDAGSGVTASGSGSSMPGP